MPLPAAFCWTKYGTEAGEPIETIIARKERERRENGGLFLWGIGNSVAPSLRQLLAITTHPEVLFSPMLSRPAAQDRQPDLVAKWQEAIGLDGEPFDLPSATLVTSRYSPQRPRHFALVCATDVPLIAGSAGEINTGSLENLSKGTPLGSSQVTAVVRRTEDAERLKKTAYPVGFRARLHFPYFVRLTSPLVCSPA
jgi:hypothetical protein